MNLQQLAKMAPPQRIAVIVGLDLIGDALIKLPFLRALRAAFPKAEISWLTASGKTAYSGALRELTKPYLDHILEQPDFLQAKRALPNTPHYDLLIDTRGRWHYAWRARRLIPHKIFLAPAARFLLSHRRPKEWWQRQTHIQDRLLQLVELAAGGVVPSVHTAIPLPAAERERAAQALPTAREAIGLVVGAGNKVKIWPLENFIALGKELQALGKTPAFLLGPDEVGLQAEIAAALPQAVFPLQHEVFAGKLSLAATMAVGERLKLAVTNDNGTSHMLAAVDCPLVSLFGPTAAHKLAPRVTHGRVVTAQEFGGDAMALIPVAAVMTAIKELLAIKQNS
jgi:ADP-heptose:LPS heptosyltransferase